MTDDRIDYQFEINRLCAASQCPNEFAQDADHEPARSIVDREASHGAKVGNSPLRVRNRQGEKYRTGLQYWDTGHDHSPRLTSLIPTADSTSNQFKNPKSFTRRVTAAGRIYENGAYKKEISSSGHGLRFMHMAGITRTRVWRRLQGMRMS